MKTNAHIYVMRANDGTLKLGHSRNPESRAKQIGRPVEVVHQTDVIEQVERIERLAHRVLALHGRHIKGEWFEATLEQAILAIEVATKQAEGQEFALGAVLGRPDLPARREAPVISLRIPIGIKTVLATLAKRERRSLANMITVALEEYIERHGHMTCPDCMGVGLQGQDEDGEPILCDTCDGHGFVKCGQKVIDAPAQIT